jgi:asparagine N-glycosylation enzyme membrane subunit Stt3
MKFQKIFTSLATIAGLIFIMYLSMYVRSATLSSPTILDYDPWWYYRHAIEIMNNNLQPLKWDILSYYPPGRPFDNQLGWEYTMILFFKMASVIFKSITFLTVAKWSPLIMVALGTIPAFLLGRLLSNKWGGLATALFAVLTPTFIGVSMAGYTDNDPLVIFYIFLCAYFALLALKKKSIPFYLFAIISNILFAFNWGGGWFVLLMFTLFMPLLFVFRIVENMIHQKKIVIDLKMSLNEMKPLIIPFLVIFVFSNVAGYFLGVGHVFGSLLVGWGFVNPSSGLLVNMSVAELQKVNILTGEGFYAVASRIGLAPFLLTIIGLPVFILFKLIKKIKINYIEIFLFSWFLITFFMILEGVRFSLLFSAAAAASAGYVIGNAITHLKKDIIGITFFAIIAVLTLMFISDAISSGMASSGMAISQNWIDALNWLKSNADKNSLITTWWDPGHIITGYTGLKVHADGAHCSPGECVPYNHNVRIQDMGRIFSTSSEDEALSILKKYKSLTPEQCQEVRKEFGDIVPSNACDPVSDIYIIASSDLIGKYHWLSFFGLGNAKDFIQLPLKGYDQNQGILTYANGEITLMRKGTDWVPVVQSKYVVKEMIYFENGEKKSLDFSNATNTVDGLVWVDPSYQALIFMPPEIKNSIFTNMFFFNGENLKKFELVYTNPEMKIFKVNFS